MHCHESRGGAWGGMYCIASEGAFPPYQMQYFRYSTFNIFHFLLISR